MVTELLEVVTPRDRLRSGALPLRKVVAVAIQTADFGQKRTFIARRVSWSSDAKWVFAAVGEGDADIVMMEGLMRQGGGRVGKS